MSDFILFSELNMSDLNPESVSELNMSDFILFSELNMSDLNL